MESTTNTPPSRSPTVSPEGETAGNTGENREIPDKVAKFLHYHILKREAAKESEASSRIGGGTAVPTTHDRHTYTMRHSGDESSSGGRNN